jgi:hypothetical protein
MENYHHQETICMAAFNAVISGRKLEQFGFSFMGPIACELLDVDVEIDFL